MPRQVTTTITLSDLQLVGIYFSFPNGAAQPPEVAVQYRLLRDDGTVYETKRVGGLTMNPGLITAMRAQWTQTLAERKQAEGI